MRFVENDTGTLTHHDQEAHPPVTIADIWEAYKLLKPRLHHTPLTPSRTLRDITGADIYLKAENMQRSGSFKVRGASYKLSRLSEEEYSRGVIAASAGIMPRELRLLLPNIIYPVPLSCRKLPHLPKLQPLRGTAPK
jgi:threonine dehydratase